jgi:hypothetical protein
MRIRRLAIVLAVVVSTLVSIGVGALPAGADGAPSVDVGDVTMARSTTAVTNFVFPVTLEYASNNTVTVNYATQNGTARSTKDYATEQGTVTFAPGTVSKTVTVPVQASTLHTGQLYFYLSINAPTGAVVNHGTGTGTILDPTLNPYVNIGDSTVTQGTGSATTATFTATVSTASANPITFKYATANNSAVAGIDYTAEHGTISLAPGQVSAQIAVPIIKTSQYSASKSFYVTLSTPTNATLGTNQGIGTIVYANHTAWVTADDAAVTASTTATTTMNFAVRLTSAATFPVTVDYGTQNGTAVASNQFVPNFGSLTFAPGVTSMTVPVTVNSETSGAATTYLTLDLSGASAGSGILRGSAQGTIGGPTAGYHQLTVGDVGLVRGTSGSSTLTFAVTLQPASTGTVTVEYATQDNTATAPGDYTAKSGTLTFSPGQTTQNVAITIIGTTTTYSDKNFFLTLSAGAGAAVVRTSAYGVISNGNVEPVVSIDSLAIQKPASGTVKAAFTVHLSSASPNSVTVEAQTSDGSATAAGGDYDPESGLITIPAGQLSATAFVTINGNTVAAADRYFYLTITSPTNSVLAPNNSGVGYIANPNLNQTLSINDVSTYTPVKGTASAVFTVKLSGASTQPVTVHYATSDGSAVAGTDYNSASGTLTFTPGVVSKTVPVTVNPTSVAHANRYFSVSLSAPTNATIVSGTGTGTLVDDAVAPYVTVNNPSVASGSTSTTMTFTVTLTSPTPNPVTVNYATSNNSAVGGSQYTPTTGSLTFAPGTTVQSVPVTILPDTVKTSNLSFYLNLSSPTNATLSNPSYGLGTILNTAVDPGLSVGDVTMNRPTSGTASEVFTITLAPASPNTVTVNYGTSDGAAHAPTDYTTTTGSTTFSPGQTTKQVTVPIVGDAARTNDLYYYLNLSSPVNAQLLRSYGVGYLVDAVAPVTGLSYMTVSDAVVSVPSSGTVNATFTINLAPAQTSPVSVRYYTSDNTAVSGIDYTGVRGTLTFAAGQTSKTVTVPVEPTTAASADKLFSFNISLASGSVSVERSSGEALLVNPNPEAVVSVAGDVAVIKGDSGSANAVFTVQLSPAQSQAVEVDYATQDGSATAPDYYQPAQGTLTFAPGQTSQTVSVPIDSDTLVQPTNYFYLALSNPSGAALAGQAGVAYILDPDVFTLSGTVINPAGAAVAGATVTRTGNDQPTLTTTSAANGSFSFPNTLNGQYTLTPTLTGEAFAPATLLATVRGANVGGQAFIAYSGTAITGQATTGTAAVEAGVTVTLTGGGHATTVERTDPQGYYVFGSLPAGTGYVVTATLSGSTATPSSYTNNVATTTITNQNFVMVTGTFISGRVTKAGTGVTGVTMTLGGGITPTTKVTTNAQGYYGFSSLASATGGTIYTVTPTASAATFTPSSSSVTVSPTTDAAGTNFTES